MPSKGQQEYSLQKIGIRLNQSFSLTPARAMVLSLLVLIEIAAVILYLPVCHTEACQMNFADALFLATSCVCVTGLTTVNVATEISRTGHWAMIFFVQLGALGIILFSSSLILMLGGRLQLRVRKMIQESLPGISLTSVARLTRYIVIFVFATEIIGAMILAFAWVPEYGWDQGIFHAIFHSVGSLCGSGFSTFNNGLVDYAGNVTVNLTVMTLIVIGGLGFLVLADIFGIIKEKRSIRHLSTHSKMVLQTSLVLIVFGAIAFAFFERGNPEVMGHGLLQSIMTSFFQSITCRSGGYNTVNIDALQEETQQMMMFLMFIGGGPGSTAGGIKVTSFVLIVMAAICQLRGFRDIEVGSRRITWEKTMQALALTVTAVLCVIIVCVLLNFFEKEFYSRLLFEGVSALGTVGLSTGVTPELSTPSKLILCVSMFIGRVGPLTLASSLAAGSKAKATRKPECNIIIG